ncbi:MAG: glucose-6-phosphate isomerase [Candidatus Omnitrophica bacterium]|nr:glucose-6-phosphate isomerase [Candidatus Omnitrophota bacterium]
MEKIKFDFNNMFSHSVGKRHGATEEDIRQIRKSASSAHKHLKDVLANRDNRIILGLEWAKLPYQAKDTVKAIQRLGDEIASSYENVVSLGIGGSYLGLKAAQDALCPAYYNEFSSLRRGRPKIYFDGNNMDPDTLSVLLKNIDPKKTFIVVISKSGETTETKAAFSVIEKWLKRSVGARYGRQIIAITDPGSGTLRKKVDFEQAKDPLSFRNLSVMKGVGGRFSELNIGLLHLAIAGIDIQKVLDGAKAMARQCGEANLAKNPAYLYAVLQTIMYRKKNKSIAIVMPFSERLKSTADWYVQLLAESLGKKYARKIRQDDGREIWGQDSGNIVNTGRTPIPARGTNDLHSIQQNNIEGENNKTVTFIKVERFKDDIKVSGTGDFLEGRPYSKLISIAEEATEWALVREERPNCTITLPEISPFYWGAVLFFFEIATAFEGELLGVNAFDQPGVEGYKNYMYYKLGKPGMSKAVSDDIRSHPLLKKTKYIIR